MRVRIGKTKKTVEFVWRTREGVGVREIISWNFEAFFCCVCFLILFLCFGCLALRVSEKSVERPFCMVTVVSVGHRHGRREMVI